MDQSVGVPAPPAVGPARQWLDAAAVVQSVRTLTSTGPNPGGHSYPNGITQNYAYDLSNRVTRAAAVNAGGTTLTSSTYSYASNQNGRDTALRQTLTDQAGNKTTFSYDQLNRLVLATIKDSTGHTLPGGHQYWYDGVGNRTASLDGGGAILNSYNAANQLVSQNGSTLNYDANSNQTTSGYASAISYNAQHQTTAITPRSGGVVSFTYRGTGQAERASVQASAGTTTIGNTALGVSSETFGGVMTHYT